ncbi:S-adenosyl-L-methionine-dependent methyltransferase, partial [Phakopsora pachyrhizi]
CQTTDSKTIEKGTFQPSELGTLSFWNVNYDRELESFKEFGDEGEVWFRLWKRTTLFLLVQGGYGVENLTGIDYSAGSIELTNEIDIIKDEVNPPLLNSNGKERRGWDLITDKGTFEAICLSNEELEGRKLSEHYPSRISDLLVKPGGIFLITSCNWTEDEINLEIWLRVHSKIPRHCFTFGGNSGSTITTIAFEAC